MMFYMRTLRQKYSIYILLPVTLLVFGMGYAGFSYARNQLLVQWGEATILKLQRAAHHIDMRLSKPKDMIKLFSSSAVMPHGMHAQTVILEQLKKLDWVTRVDLIWMEPQSDSMTRMNMQRELNQQTASRVGTMRIMPFHNADIVNISAPEFNTKIGSQTVVLSSVFMDSQGNPVGRIEVEILFGKLINTVKTAGWWREKIAFLVDEQGIILASNIKNDRIKLADTKKPIERSTLYTMKSLPFGTIFGQGHPPKEISGFYKLEQAPWILVMIAPGQDIFSTVIRFRNYFFAIGVVFVLIILFIIRFVTDRTVSSINDVSIAARKVAEGDFKVSLPHNRNDEVGNLIHSFNTMVVQLEEGAIRKYNLNLAKEVQQNLLPGESENFKSLDIAGRSIYCDETGGDYYDFIRFPEFDNEQIGVVVGDVSGHGIASSLFMTSARGMIRSRMMQNDSPSNIITNVNHLICKDTTQNGNFITLFFLLVDAEKKEMKWVRAGHDPAILYDAAADTFEELNGEGLVIGVDENWAYKEYIKKGWHENQVILIGTDGIWETKNEVGEQFGKTRLRKILKTNHHKSAAEIIKAIITALDDFRKTAAQEDDITAVIIKPVS